MRVCPTCQVASVSTTSMTPCWLCGGDTYEQPVSIAGGATVDLERCWADHRPEPFVISICCTERNVTRSGLCASHYLELVS